MNKIFKEINEKGSNLIGDFNWTLFVDLKGLLAIFTCLCVKCTKSVQTSVVSSLWRLWANKIRLAQDLQTWVCLRFQHSTFEGKLVARRLLLNFEWIRVIRGFQTTIGSNHWKLDVSNHKSTFIHCLEDFEHFEQNLKFDWNFTKNELFDNKTQEMSVCSFCSFKR